MRKSELYFRPNEVLTLVVQVKDPEKAQALVHNMMRNAGSNAAETGIEVARIECGDTGQALRDEIEAFLKRLTNHGLVL